MKSYFPAVGIGANTQYLIRIILLVPGRHLSVAVMIRPDGMLDDAGWFLEQHICHFGLQTHPQLRIVPKGDVEAGRGGYLA